MSSTVEISEENPTEPVKLSKNQQRKQKRYALLLERRKSKRKEEREKHKRRRQERLLNADPSAIARSQIRNRRMSESDCRIRICIDCRYDSMMNDKDVASLQKQISFSYSANRRSEDPCQFYLTNVDGQLHRRLLLNAADKWDIHLHQENLEEVFPHDEILYLTSESENVLSRDEPLDERTVYVIGGLVDHNSRKGLCYQLAKEKNWRHARLPIDEFIQMKTRRVLACNHVLEILLNYIHLGDWKKAFEEHIPKRKQQNPSDDESEDDRPKTVSPHHPDQPENCAEIHQRREEIDLGESKSVVE